MNVLAKVEAEYEAECSRVKRMIDEAVSTHSHLPDGYWKTRYSLYEKLRAARLALRVVNELAIA